MRLDRTTNPVAFYTHHHTNHPWWVKEPTLLDMTNQSILVATIGTRDLAFKLDDNQWMNVGNDRSPHLESISEQVQVQYELGLESEDFRSITKYLFDNYQTYKDRIKPIIIGQLLEDERKNLEKVYLIATDQPPETGFNFWSKDTIYSAELIKLYISDRFNCDAEVITYGKTENPSDFEKMFDWCKKLWKRINITTEAKLLLCLKGGVGQAAEAARVSAISYFQENTFFYDFIADVQRNQKGLPSLYHQPSKGASYLWDRRKQEALSLLARKDYTAVERILSGYLKDSSDPENLRIKKLLKAAIAWNKGDFQALFSAIEDGKERGKQWWANAYEAAYLAIIRLEQDNTTEALFHSFRAVEGLMVQWIVHRYQPHITKDENDTPSLHKNVCSDANFPELNNRYYLFDYPSIKLYGTKLDIIWQSFKPQAAKEKHWQNFYYAREKRNEIFHRLLKLDEQQLYSAWNCLSKEKWQKSVLSCLNDLSNQNFTSLENASLMFKIHHQLKDLLTTMNYS